MDGTEDGALDMLGVELGMVEGELLGSMDKEGVSDGAPLNDGAIEGAPLYEDKKMNDWHVKQVQVQKQIIIRYHNHLGHWGSEGPIDGSAEVEGVFEGSWLGFWDELGFADGNEVLGDIDGAYEMEGLSDGELESIYEGLLLNDGKIEGVTLGVSEGLITGNNDRLGPYEGISEGDVVGALVTSCRIQKVIFQSAPNYTLISI